MFHCSKYSYDQTSNIVEITELPLWVWNQNYRKRLEKYLDGPGNRSSLKIKKIEENHSTLKLSFKLHLCKGAW
jgi:hypothetical protein